jgi:hypothetical protein
LLAVDSGDRPLVSIQYLICCGLACRRAECCAAISIRRTDDAFKELEASFLNGFSYFDEMQKDPDLDAIRNDPRFTALIKKYRTTT